jgi:hypothetical protein
MKLDITRIGGKDMDIATITGAYTAIKAIKEIGSSLLDAKIDSEAKQRASVTY